MKKVQLCLSIQQNTYIRLIEMINEIYIIHCITQLKIQTTKTYRIEELSTFVECDTSNKPTEK